MEAIAIQRVPHPWCVAHPPECIPVVSRAPCVARCEGRHVLRRRPEPSETRLLDGVFRRIGIDASESQAPARNGRARGRTCGHIAREPIDLRRTSSGPSSSSHHTRHGRAFLPYLELKTHDKAHRLRHKKSPAGRPGSGSMRPDSDQPPAACEAAGLAMFGMLMNAFIASPTSSGNTNHVGIPRDCGLPMLG